MQSTVAVRYKKNGNTKIGLLEDKLAVVILGRGARKLFRRRLLRLGILDRGHGGKATAQERVAIRRGGKVIKKPRFIVIDEKSYEQALRRLPRNSDRAGYTRHAMRVAPRALASILRGHSEPSQGSFLVPCCSSLPKISFRIEGASNRITHFIPAISAGSRSTCA